MKKSILLLLLLPLFSQAQIINTLPSRTSTGGFPFYVPEGLTREHNGTFYVADRVDNQILKRNISGLVTVVAGSTAAGFSGDGGPGIDARLNGPTCIISDKKGNLYFTDQSNSAVRKIDTSGIITTIAGTGSSGYSGDGHAATTAKLSFPIAITFDKSGNLFIADNHNNVVRKVDTLGVITTVAGNGFGAGTGGGYSGDGGLATLAEMFNPSAVIFDNIGNLYISDASNNVVRKVNTSGIISTFAGNHTVGYSGDGGMATSAQLNAPQIGLAADSLNNIYISDASNNVIRVVNSSGTINTYAGNGTNGFSGDGGPATRAQCYNPSQIAMDAAGNIYFADANNGVLREVSGISGIANICLGDSTLFVEHVGSGHWYSSNSAVASVSLLGRVTGISAGNASIGYVAGTDTASMPVIVTAVPTAGIINGADSTCLGVSNDTLSDTTPGGYWTTASTTISLYGGSTIYATAGGIDTIFYIVPYSCGIDTASFIVTVVNANPCCITGRDTVCIGDTVLLSHVGVAGGTWSVYDTSMAAVLAPGEIKGIVSGEEFVIYTVNGGLPGCVLSSYFTLEVMPSSYCRITEVPVTNALTNAITLFPDPAYSELNINSNVPIKEIMITNYLGEHVYRSSFGQHQVTINISSLPAGVYVALINGSEVRKFIKE